MSENFFDREDNDNVSIRAGTPPAGDVIFLPTDPTGTPGQLNSLILRQLGLDTSVIPTMIDSKRQYELVVADGQKICFVVTVGNGKSADLLSMNLLQALGDGGLSDAKSLWIPLMGTGSGRLSLESSRQIITSALTVSGWRSREDVRITLSFPPGMLIKQEAFEGLQLDESVWAALQFAAGLRIGYKDDDASISTTLLFFAIASSQRMAAPPELSADRSASLFSGAVHSLAGSRYVDVQRDYFPRYRRAPSGSDAYFWPAHPSPNVFAVLRGAADVADAAGRSLVTVNDVIVVLIAFSQGRHRLCMQKMGISVDALQHEYGDALAGDIGKALLNDVAALSDQLGYDSYAEAIKDFLVDVATPPPISISIQAPWGAGKSSLMHQIRNKLDPADERNKNKPKGSVPLASRLKVKDALAFLDQAGSPIRHDKPEPGKLWSVWFNAWKYDTTEQVWAGLVDAIVSQISERLTPFDRELFLFRLQLARIDDGIVRRKIYDRIVTIWWQKMRNWTLGSVATIVSLLGLHKAASVEALPKEIVELLAVSPVFAGIGFAIMLVAKYASTAKKTSAEPAAFSLAQYLQVPDYGHTLGTIHHIHRDLMRVLSLTPKRSDAKLSTPIVVFIDDLDRCSPTKIASVVEGVSMFLASEDYRCMFVIGMDPQMIAAALEESHAKVRERLPTYERAVPLGWRFMDKFIQLPFTIPPASGENLTRYLDGLTNIEIAAAISTNLPIQSLGAEGGIIGSTLEGHNGMRESPRMPAAQNVEHPQADTTGAVSRAATSDAPTPLPESVTKFRESRDVGELIRDAAGKMSGNPREIKRLANLARLYLGLRNARRRRQPSWHSPDVSQYARWITLTLRWPDMMRWLQWGADEGASSLGEPSIMLSERRLRVLQEEAGRVKSVAEWSGALKDHLGLSCERPTDWTNDPRLFEFFQSEALLDEHETLRAAVASGFW